MLTLTSTAFTEGGTIPRDHTCDGADRSPPLSWSGTPAGTAVFALICDDPDAPVGTWDHWVIWDIPGDAVGLPEGVAPLDTLPDGARQGRNGWGTNGYRGPCPPHGKPHRYYFRLYALDASLGLPPGATKSQLLRAIKGNILAQAELMGRYGR
ncbi:MAG: YbhB/YbcL family Raf kinase inhibitor-like protein [Anaerolineae bacterium]